MEKLLHPTTKKVISLKRNPFPLPSDSLLIRTPTRKSARLPAALIGDTPQIQYGQHIYVYKNIRTNQVVYSLTRHLNNRAAIAQLPFLGKKTVPARLRKDLWQPFCLTTFPSPHAGLLAYRKLREFRRLHETRYPRSLIRDPDNPRANLSKKAKGKVLMDQKANTVADLAAVLLQQEAGISQERKDQYKRRKARWDQLKKMGSKKIHNRKEPLNVGAEFEGVEGVRVYWSNIRDAEYAQTWPKDVEHSGLQTHRYTAAWPVMKVEAVQEQQQDFGIREKGTDLGGAVSEKPEEVNGRPQISKPAEGGEVREVESKPPASLFQRAKERIFGR